MNSGRFLKLISCVHTSTLRQQLRIDSAQALSFNLSLRSFCKKLWQSVVVSEIPSQAENDVEIRYFE